MPASFRLLGPLEVSRAGAAIPIGRRRERCLLAVLLLAPRIAVSRERLIDLLWEDERPERVVASLHASISRLRSSLEDGHGGHGISLVNRDGGYAADVDPSTVDAHRFRALIERADRAEQPAERIRLLEAALTLWRGPVLADDAWPRLRDRICADLGELRMKALTMLSDTKLACGRGAELIGELTAYTAEHPLHEPLVGRLMLALCRSGRPAEAIQTFECSRRRMADELGVDPGPELRQLHTAILRQDTAVFA